MSTPDCLFCKIISGDIPSTKVYADDHVYAFRDIHPKAPHHILVIPKKHFSTLNDMVDEPLLLGKIQAAAISIAAELDVAEEGFRTVTNCNEFGGQEVYHVHLHLLAGRQLKWPPG